MKSKQRVICAMSGGVDSSVAAALLKDQGYEVIGIFMKFWTEERSGFSTALEVKENVCCSVDAATAARAVAQKLGIPFYVVNFAKEFKKAVVDYYIKEYEQGRTPNPCVICNRDIKGEVLMKKVLELDADYLATGHYAQIKKEGDIYHFLQGADQNKDQTYFLWTLTQEKLVKMLFPIGKFAKSEVRTMAKKMQLPTAQRRESQGICFIPDRDVCGFLHRHGKKLTKPGQIVNLNGDVVGTHDGLINYTVGQRQHLGLGGPKSYYVVRLDSKNNQLVVGDDRDLYQKALIVTGLNWIQPAGIKAKGIKAVIRYRHLAVSCKLEILGQDEIKVTFNKEQRAITPGQSIVFYDKNEVLGGGVINESL